MKNKSKNPSCGFSYYVNDEQLREYHSWPVTKRVEWLYAVNLMRTRLPVEVRKIQDKFRSGEI